MDNKDIRFPITEETFHDAWVWVDTQRRNSIVRKYVRKISSSVGNLVFFLLMCVIMFGYYMQIEGVYFQVFLRTVPVLPQVWDWLTVHIFKPELGIWEQLGLLAVFLYGITFTLECLCSGIVRLCCRPKEIAEPTGTVQETSVLLLAATERLAMSKRISYISGSVLYNIFFLLFNIGLILAFVFIYAMGGDQELLEQLTFVLGSYPLILFVIVCWIGFPILNYPLQQLSRLLYVMKLPENLLEEVNAYVLVCDPEKQARLIEEDRILALAEEIKKRRAKEKEALLK